MTEQDQEVERLRDLVAELRVERDDALALAASSQRECQILHLGQRGIAAARLPPAASPAVDVSPRTQQLEHAVGVLDSLARDLAQWDCSMDSLVKEAYGEPCYCEACRAKRALAKVASWRAGTRERPTRRFIGALYQRTTDGWSPAEARLHAAWCDKMDDRKLGMILTDRIGHSNESYDWPSARDWYVATSVVQWLGTAIGSNAILRSAGYRIDPEIERADCAALDAKREEESRLQ